MEANSMMQFMVEFDVPVPFPPHLLLKIPEHRMVVNELFQEGKLVSYALSEDRDRLWAVFSLDREEDLEVAIGRLPLSPYMSYRARRLLFHQSVRLVPTSSLN